MKPDCFYTYLDKVNDPKTLAFSHYVLYYKIELSARHYPISLVPKVMTTGNPRLIPDPLGVHNYELVGFEEKVGDHLCEIVLTTKHTPSGGTGIPPLTGSIKIKKNLGGVNFSPKKQWEEIAIRMIHKHPHSTHDGSSTSHLGDGD